MLVVLSSATGAERLKKMLASEKIHSEIIQTPKSFSKGGCSYSLRFDSRYQNEIKNCISKLRISAKGFFNENN